jgi:uncharacterized protein (TIGR02246 family)
MTHPIVDLYRGILEGWNARNAKAMTETLASDATVIGFDGSVHSGRETIESQMADLFRDHPTARYVADLEMVREIGPAGALLRAVAGLVPPASRAVKAEVNAHHTVVAERLNDRWQVLLYQNTAAQFHGRPQLVEQMTKRLQEVSDLQLTMRT